MCFASPKCEALMQGLQEHVITRNNRKVRAFRCVGASVVSGDKKSYDDSQGGLRHSGSFLE